MAMVETNVELLHSLNERNEAKFIEHLIDGESIQQCYETYRGFVTVTNKRVIISGYRMNGRSQEQFYTHIPYKTIKFMQNDEGDSIKIGTSCEEEFKVVITDSPLANHFVKKVAEFICN